MKLFKCIKIIFILAVCTVFLCPMSNAKGFKKDKNKPVINATPFEIDEEFKGEFEYYDVKEEKLKLKEEKKNSKIEKKHQKLINKKKKLEKKQQKSSENVKKYTEYKEKLENTFLPAGSSEE